MSMKNRSNPKSYSPTRGRYKGRTFSSKHAYRNKLARAKGFRNDYARRTAYKSLSTLGGIEKISPRIAQKRNDALQVISLMRRGGRNLTQARREFNRLHPDSPISFATIKKYAKPALIERGGRVRAKPFDRLSRHMLLPTKRGVISVEVKDSRTASSFAGYENAVKVYMHTGDDSPLHFYEGKYFTSNRVQYRFVTDTDILDRLAEFGELEFDSIYTQLDGE